MLFGGQDPSSVGRRRSVILCFVAMQFGVHTSALEYIFPGEGSSGTRTVQNWLRCHGVRTLHWRQTEVQQIITNMTLADFPRADFRHLLRNFDAALDTPMMALWPFLFQAFPEAKIVLVSRPAAEWRHSRMRGHPNSPRPFAWAFRGNLLHTPDAPTWSMKYSEPIDEILYDANYALIRERAKDRKFMEVPLSKLCERVGALEAFLGLKPKASCRLGGC